MTRKNMSLADYFDLRSGKRQFPEWLVPERAAVLSHPSGRAKVQVVMFGNVEAMQKFLSENERAWQFSETIFV